MAGESKESASLPYSSILGLLLVAAAAFVHNARLDSVRPAAEEEKARSLSKRALHQDVESRLWEDPVAAVVQYRERERAKAMRELQLRRQGAAALGTEKSALPPDDLHQLGNLTGWINEQMCKEKEEVRLLLPMVMGGRTEEDAEMRRRTRYAVVSGLMNSGFNPDDASALGYVHVPPSATVRSKYSRFPEILPFEWFGRPVNGKSKSKDWVLVVWLDESKFQGNPLGRLRGLVNALAPPCIAKTKKEKFDATILGPVTSDVLALVIEGIAIDDSEPERL